MTEEAPARIADLIALGVSFDEEPGLEGGHSRPRIFSVDGAATGERIARVLAEAVLARPLVEVSEDELAQELWVTGGRCVGLVTNRRAVTARSPAGDRRCCAALWEQTTNPRARPAMASQWPIGAGAAVADLEFVQLHPTALAGTSLAS